MTNRNTDRNHTHGKTTPIRDIERIAALQEPVGRFSDSDVILLYHAFRGLYAEFRAHTITHDQAKQDRAVLVQSFNAVHAALESSRILSDRVRQALDRLDPNDPVAMILDGRYTDREVTYYD